jgi:hypothetical protein
MSITLQHVYERQQAAERARWDVSETFERIYWDLDKRERDVQKVHEHEAYRAAQAEADRLTAEVAELRAEVGGSVFRVVNSKLDELATRIEKLNKKAAKLGTDAITLTVSDEHDQTITRESLVDQDIADIYGQIEGSTFVERVVDYTFVTVNGETPLIAGWVFVATLDHEADEGADEAVGIRRAPVGARLAERIGAEAAAAVEHADLTAYRHASNDCDHCGFNRRRKQTYVLHEVATGELKQIGSTCVKDFIPGAHNPERIAAWAEWLEGLYRDLGTGLGEEGGGGGRIAVRTLDYLANVAAVIRERGWSARWFKSDYGDFERNHGATADVAMGNVFERKAKYKIPVTDEDHAEAKLALDWVRDDLGERDELSEFEHNLTTYCTSDYVPEKGDGFIAYAIMARRRAVEKVLETERKEKVAATSEWFGEIKSRVKGLTFTVTFTRSFESAYGVRVLTKGFTPDGNSITWWGNGGGMEQGKTYSAAATIKAHETDDYNGGAKTTVITNLRSIEEVEGDDAEAAEMETTKTAAEREAERLRRIDPTELEERIDSARASYNDYTDLLSHETGQSFDGSLRRYYEETRKRIGGLVTRLEADQRALRELAR